MTNTDPHQPGQEPQHPPAPPPAPGLGGPGFSAYGGYTPVAQPGLAATARPSRLGLVAVIVGGVALLIDVVFAVVQAGLVAGASYSVFGAVAVVRNVILVLLALTAIVLGAMGLARGGGSKALAGIGVGIGAALVVDAIASVLYTTLATAITR